jgi:hypothetical protein
MMNHKSETTLHNAFLEILPAHGRSAAIPPADDIYDFLIGSWELDLVAYDDEGNVTKSTGEAHVAWVLEGRAIQDLFINPPDPTAARTRRNMRTGMARRCAFTTPPFARGGSLGSIRTTGSAPS